MSSNKDSRGIVRGQCTLCHCDSYAGGTEGLKCYRCKHAPAQHENLSTPKTSIHPTGEMRISCVYCSGELEKCTCVSDFYTSTGLGSRDTRTRTFAQAAGSSGSSVYQGSHSHHSEHQHRHVPRSLPKCKADRCSNRVHYEEGVGEFDYCSPGCRDKHLLPTEQKSLKKDLEDLAKHLHVHVAPKQSKNKPPDLERQFSGGNQGMYKYKSGRNETNPYKYKYMYGFTCFRYCKDIHQIVLLTSRCCNSSGGGDRYSIPF